MTWQEELRRLDSDLANGLISTGQHRLRQEEILAQASGAPTSAAPTTSKSDTTAPSDTVSPPEHVPAPEQHRVPEQQTPPGAADPEESSGAETHSESIDAQPPHGSAKPEALLETSRPTTAPSPADSRGTDSVAHPGVQPAPRASPSTPAPMPSAAQATPPDPDEFLSDGPGAISPPPRRRRPKNWALASGVAIVVALVTVGFWWIITDQDMASDDLVAGTPVESPSEASDGDPGTDSGENPAEETTDSEDFEDRLPALPGEPSESNGTIPVDQGADINLYSHAAAEVLAENGVDEVTFHRSSEKDGDDYLVVLAPTSSSDNAHDVITFLRDSEIRAGGTETTSGITGSNEAGRMSGTWYTSDSVAIAIWVSQALDRDPDELEQRLNDTVYSLQESFPEK